MTVRRDGDSATALLEWAFGAGDKAWTAVGFFSGAWIEHRISWYREPARIGLTPGHPVQTPPEPGLSLGVIQTGRDAFRCFNCHATSVGEGPDLARMIPGVTCERCHGAGSDHVAAIRAGRPAAGTVVNPRRMEPSGVVQFCGACHRSPDREFRSHTPEAEDPASVRFATVGFDASACYRAGRKFSCVSCHDPHGELRTTADSRYTAVCSGCHQVRTACPAPAGSSCVACHMKKSTPMPHLTFTDHRIRVYVE